MTVIMLQVATAKHSNKPPPRGRDTTKLRLGSIRTNRRPRGRDTTKLRQRSIRTNRRPRGRDTTKLRLRSIRTNRRPRGHAYLYVVFPLPSSEYDIQIGIRR